MSSYLEQSHNPCDRKGRSVRNPSAAHGSSDMIPIGSARGTRNDYRVVTVFQDRYRFLMFPYTSTIRLMDYRVSDTSAVPTGAGLRLRTPGSWRWGERDMFLS